MRNAIGMMLAAATLAGCGGGDKQTVKTDDGTIVAVNESRVGNIAQVSMTTPDGNTTTMTASENGGQVQINIPGMGATITTGGNWPQGLAAVAPAYPGAAVTGSFAGAGPDGGGGTVSFTSSDAAEKIIDFYKARATAAGLGVTMSGNAGGSQMFTASDDKTGRSLTVQAAVEDGKTTGSIMYGAGNKR